MEDKNRISITICGDGGCGMKTPGPRYRAKRSLTEDSSCRKIFNHTTSGTESMDARVGRIHHFTIRPTLTFLFEQVRPYNRYYHDPST